MKTEQITESSVVKFAVHCTAEVAVQDSAQTPMLGMTCLQNHIIIHIQVHGAMQMWVLATQSSPKKNVCDGLVVTNRPIIKFIVVITISVEFPLGSVLCMVDHDQVHIQQTLLLCMCQNMCQLLILEAQIAKAVQVRCCVPESMS